MPYPQRKSRGMRARGGKAKSHKQGWFTVMYAIHFAGGSASLRCSADVAPRPPRSWRGFARPPWFRGTDLVDALAEPRGLVLRLPQGPPQPLVLVLHARELLLRVRRRPVGASRGDPFGLGSVARQQGRAGPMLLKQEPFGVRMVFGAFLTDPNGGIQLGGKLLAEPAPAPLSIRCKIPSSRGGRRGTGKGIPSALRKVPIFPIGAKPACRHRSEREKKLGLFL